MASDTAAIESGFPIIADELAKIREQQKNEGRVFANLFTLILYAQEQSKIETLRNIVQSVIKKFPCRIIFIEGHLNEDFDIKIDVSSIVDTNNDSYIACDSITIFVGKHGLQRVPSLVLPTILPDLPVHLFWGDEPSKDDALFSLLEKIANRLIFLGPEAEGLQAFSTKTLQSFDTHPCAILDFDWALIGGWRDVLSSCLSETFVEELNKIESIHLIYNSSSNAMIAHPDICAIYLLFWLASRMGWTLKNNQLTNQSFEFVFQSSDHTINAVITSKELPSLGGIVQSVELANSNGFHALFCRQNNQAKVRIQITTQDQCELPYTLFLPDPRRGLTFMKEIFYLPTSQHYKQMLQLLTQLKTT